MKRNKYILFTIGLLLTSQKSMAEEKWYTPVDIGQHIDSTYIIEEKLNEAHIKEIFKKGTFIQEKALKKYEKRKVSNFEPAKRQNLQFIDVFSVSFVSLWLNNYNRI